jgi:hypothetical protein
MGVKTNDELKSNIKMSLEILDGFVEDAFESLKEDDMETLDIELDQITIESRKLRRSLDEIFDNEDEDE